MVPILTMSNIDSHESFFQNSFFSVSSSVESTPLNDNTRVLSIGVIIFQEVKEVREFIFNELSQFVRSNNIDNGTEYDTFIIESSKFGGLLQHCAIDLNFELDLINEFFINLIDDLNSNFVN